MHYNHGGIPVNKMERPRGVNLIYSGGGDSLCTSHRAEGMYRQVSNSGYMRDSRLKSKSGRHHAATQAGLSSRGLLSYNYSMSIEQAILGQLHKIEGFSRVGNSLFCSFALHSFAHLLIALMLKLKRDCERFAQVAHDKRATVSKSLRSLLTKERL